MATATLAGPCHFAVAGLRPSAIRQYLSCFALALLILCCPAALAQDRPVPAEIARFERLLIEGDGHLAAQRFAEALAVFESLVAHADEHESLERQLPLALARVAESSVGVGSAAKAKGLAALDRMVEIDEQFGEDERVIAWRRALQAMPNPEPQGPSAEEIARERRIAIFAVEELLDMAKVPGINDADRAQHLDAAWVYLRPMVFDPLLDDPDAWERIGRFAAEVGESGPVVDRELAGVAAEALRRVGRTDEQLRLVGRLDVLVGPAVSDRVRRLRERHMATFVAASGGDPAAQVALSELFDPEKTDWASAPVLRHPAGVVHWLEKAAEVGHIEAMNRLAVRLMSGWGVPSDQRRAVELIEQAYDASGSPWSWRLMVQAYSAGLGTDAKRDQAVYTQRRARADQGDTKAMTTVGLMFETGRSVAKDEAEAVVWYQRAADLGFADAQVRLGECYERGKGVEKDETRAVLWYRKAADQDNALGSVELARLFFRGKTIARDIDEYVRLIDRAIEQDDPLAFGIRGNDYEWVGVDEIGLNSGTFPFRKDEAEAVQWYRKGAEQGYAAIQNNLGVMYEYGRGVPKDEAEAVRGYRRAAEQGAADAAVNRGVMYMSGRGVAQDNTEAVRWYSMAADKGNAKAQNNLGAMYMSGRGVQKNEAEAIRLWKLAARQGQENAQQNLRARGESW